MIRRYGLLALAVVAAALLLAWIGAPRLPGGARAARSAVSTTVLDVALAVRDGAMEPDFVSVPKGATLRLRIRNEGTEVARLVLAGYEDRLAIPALASGATWSGVLAAERPGEDFAWLVDGKPAARLAVTGSHLVEGHR